MNKDQDGNISLRLAKKFLVTQDTYIFRFSFTDPEYTFGLPVGQHVIFSATVPTPEKPQGDLVCRKYTPISTVNNSGYVDFVIKIYRKGIHPKFPDGGLMTQYLESLKNGDTMLMEGPKGRLVYEGEGKFIISRKALPQRKTKIGMVAGGTGITPCYQVIQSALNGNDGTQLTLIYGSRTVEDIILREELIQLAQNNPQRFKLHLTVDIKPEDPNWKGGVGFVTKEMIKAYLPAPSPETIILYCGPPIFEDMMKGHVEALGYSNDQQFKF